MLSVLLLPCQRRREGWPGWEGEGEGEEGVEVEKVVVSGAWGELRPRESVRKGEEDTRSERPKMRRRGRGQSRAGQSRTEQGRAGQGRAGQQQAYEGERKREWNATSTATRKFDFQIGVARANGSREAGGGEEREGSGGVPNPTQSRCTPCPCIRGNV